MKMTFWIWVTFVLLCLFTVAAITGLAVLCGGHFETALGLTLVLTAIEATGNIVKAYKAGTIR